MPNNRGLTYTAQFSFLPDTENPIPRFEIGSTFITIYYNGIKIFDHQYVKQIHKFLLEDFDISKIMHHSDEIDKTYYHSNSRNLASHYHIVINNSDEFEDCIRNFLEYMKNVSPLKIADEDIEAITMLIDDTLATQRNCRPRCSLI